VIERGATVSEVIDRTILPLDERLGLRGIGLIWGLDTAAIDPSGALAKTIAKQCFEDGLVIERVGRSDTVLKILPPLTISPADLDEGLAILAAACANSLHR
jgi:diaminobutyrate-2-oxoglutarate transaminase